jgi:iron complex outermembrane receptor protein
MQFPEQRDEADAGYIYRSNNETHGVTAGVKGRHRDISYQLRYTGLYYGDYRVPASNFTYSGFVLPIENNRLKNTAGKENHGAFRFAVHRPWGYSMMSFSTFNQKVGIFSGAVGVPRSYLLDHDGDFRNVNLPYQQTSHTKVLSNSNIKVGKHWLEVDLGYQYNFRQEYSRPDAHGQPVSAGDTLALDLRLQTFSANVRFQANHNSRWKGIYGFQTSTKDNQHAGFEFLIPDYNDAALGIFSIHRFQWTEKLLLSGGLRLDYGYLNVEETDFPFYYRGELIDTIKRNESFKRNFFNYGASIGLAYNPDEHLSFKFNFGKSYRIPNAPELSSNGVHHGTFRFEKANPNLNSEEGYQTDLGLLFHRHKINLQAGAYFNWFQNYIYLRPTGTFPKEVIDGQTYPYPETGQLYEYTQAPVLHWGGELAVQYRPIDPVLLEVSGEYTWLQNRETSLPLPFTPPGSIKTGLQYDLPIPGNVLKNWFIAINWAWYAAQNRVDRNEPETPSYNLLSMSLGGNVGKDPNRLEIMLVINNLTNRYYLSHLSRYRILNIPEPGINANLKVTWRFARSGGKN